MQIISSLAIHIGQARQRSGITLDVLKRYLRSRLAVRERLKKIDSNTATSSFYESCHRLVEMNPHLIAIRSIMGMHR